MRRGKLIITVESNYDSFEDTPDANRDMIFYIIEHLTPFNPDKVSLSRNVPEMTEAHL